MRNTEDAERMLQEMAGEEDALNQSMALVKIVMQMLKTKAKESKRLWIALIVSISINLLIVGGFLWYESQWVYTETVTTEVEQDTEDNGNNMLQIGDNPQLILGGKGDKYGEAISPSNSD